MFILHITVYILFAYIMSYFAKSSMIFRTDNDGIDKYIWYYIIFFTLIAAVRWNVGSDALSYAHIFANGYRGDGGEVFYVWLSNYLSNNGIHFSIGLGIYAFIQIYFLTKGFIESKYLLIFLPIIMFGGEFFFSLMGGVRQMTAACVFFFAIKYIYEKKLVNYIVTIILLSVFIHKSSLLLLPIYFIPNNFEVAQKRSLLLSVFILCFVLGMTPQFKGALQYIESIVTYIGYDRYTDRVNDIIGSGNYTEETRVFGPMQLSYFLSALSTIIFGPMLYDRYSGKLKYFNLWFLFNVVYVCAYFLVCNTSHLMIRPIQYFHPFHIAILTLLLYDLCKQSEVSNQKRQLAIILVLIIWVSTSWDIFKHRDNINYPVVYKTFFWK